MTATETYFIAWKGRRDGPFTIEQLADLLQKGEIGLLHRVETLSGAMPLRQLLLAADPARWSSLALTPGSRVPFQSPGYSPNTAPNPFESPRPNPTETSASAANPFGFAPPPQPETQSSKLETSSPSSAQPQTVNRKPETSSSSEDPPAALRAYIICGCTTRFPPRAWCSLKLAKTFARDGHPLLAQRLKILSLTLAPTGLLFWLLIWRMS